MPNKDLTVKRQVKRFGERMGQGQWKNGSSKVRTYCSCRLLLTASVSGLHSFSMRNFLTFKSYLQFQSVALFLSLYLSFEIVSTLGNTLFVTFLQWTSSNSHVTSYWNIRYLKPGSRLWKCRSNDFEYKVGCILRKG